VVEKLREPSEIFLVGIQTKGRDGTLGGAFCAGIEHAGKLWLVPQWLNNLTDQVTMPERMICLEGLPYQQGGRLGRMELRYVLNYPIPTAVLYEENPPKPSHGFVVEMRPAIKFRGMQPSIH
jgi:hypothetical protein